MSPDQEIDRLDLEMLATDLKAATQAADSMWDTVYSCIRSYCEMHPGLAPESFGPLSGMAWATSHAQNMADQIYEMVTAVDDGSKEEKAP